MTASALSVGSSRFQRASDISNRRSVDSTRMLWAMAGSGSGTTP